MTKEDKIRQARAEYARQYRKNHPERVKAAQDRYWLKKSEKAAKEQEAANADNREDCT